MSPVLIFDSEAVDGKVASLNVEVTAVDIQEGEPLDVSGCPIAIATTRAAYEKWGRKDLLEASIVNSVLIRCSTAPFGERFLGRLPVKARAARAGFDNGLGMKPLKFTVRGRLR